MNVHGQDGGTTADIKNDLVLEDVLVLYNGVHVGLCANLIFLSRRNNASAVSSGDYLAGA